MRILHCSDIHLGRRIAGASGDFSNTRFDDYFNAFDYVIEYSIENNIDIFVVAGDLFDKKEISPDVLSRTEDALSKLKLANIITIVIEGNHDNIKFGKEDDSWIYYLEKKELIKRPFYTFNEGAFECIPIKIGNVHFYGLGYPGYWVDNILLEFSEYISRDEGIVNYLIVHTALAGGDIMPGVAKFTSIDKLKEKVDYIAGGHFHSYSEYPKDNPIFYVPGSLEMWEFSEFRQTKGFVVFDSNTKLVEFHHAKNRAKKVINLVITDENLDDAYSSITRLMHNEEIESDCICYVFIKLSYQLELDISIIEKYLADRGVIKSFVKVFDTNSKSIEFSGYDSSVNEIEKDIISNWNKFNRIPIETYDFLQRLKVYQNESSEGDFLELTDLFLNSAITGISDDN